MKAFRTISTLSIFNNREIFFHKRIISLKVNKIDNTPPKLSTLVYGINTCKLPGFFKDNLFISILMSLYYKKWFKCMANHLEIVRVTLYLDHSSSRQKILQRRRTCILPLYSGIFRHFYKDYLLHIHLHLSREQIRRWRIADGFNELKYIYCNRWVINVVFKVAQSTSNTVRMWSCI